MWPYFLQQLCRRSDRKSYEEVPELFSALRQTGCNDHPYVIGSLFKLFNQTPFSQLLQSGKSLSEPQIWLLKRLDEDYDGNSEPPCHSLRCSIRWFMGL